LIVCLVMFEYLVLPRVDNDGVDVIVECCFPSFVRTKVIRGSAVTDWAGKCWMMRCATDGNGWVKVIK